jgi:hypothetical protein
MMNAECRIKKEAASLRRATDLALGNSSIPGMDAFSLRSAFCIHHFAFSSFAEDD